MTIDNATAGETLQIVLDQSAAAESDYQQTLIAENVSGHLPDDARQIIKGITGALATGRREINIDGAVDDILNNDVMPFDGRARLAEERIDKAAAQLGEAVAYVDRTASIARAILSEAARPKVTPGQELAARADAQMLLAAGDATALMADLAERQDDIGALVTSAWGRDYLRAQGVTGSHMDAVTTLVNQAMLDAAAAQRVDDSRRAAAVAANNLHHLMASRDALNAYGHQLIPDLQDRTRRFRTKYKV